jgi:hypothetical protein
MYRENTEEFLEKGRKKTNKKKRKAQTDDAEKEDTPRRIGTRSKSRGRSKSKSKSKTPKVRESELATRNTQAWTSVHDVPPLPIAAIFLAHNPNPFRSSQKAATATSKAQTPIRSSSRVRKVKML